MRGIPSSVLTLFFAFVYLVEFISYLGFRQLIYQATKKIQWYLSLLFFLISFFTIGMLIYAFSNPESIRQSRDYTFFNFVIVVSFLNLAPKSFFALMTILSYLIRWIAGLREQIITLLGSLLVGSGIFIVFSYGIFIGRYQVIINRQDLYFDNLPAQLDSFKIVQLSDIHLGSFRNDPDILKKTIKMIETIQPDLLLFTGDIVNNFGDEMKGFEPYLKQLSARYGKYAIQGNHDYGDYYEWPDSISKQKNLDQIESGLTQAGFKLLLNQWDKIIVKDTSFALIGVENWGHKPFPQYANLDVAMKGVPANSFKILMSHDPAHWKAIVLPQSDIPLTLSGHTHGGQFGLKIAGIEFSPIYIVQKYWGGLYKSGNQYLYVNRGLGTIGFSGRIEMNPEITLLTLFRTKNH
ncbi:MAG: metallophosphoesterase [Prolixibacteraceae bacterium]|nr:metallophosphoesterase [Prolixibacteraceae bacterium]